MTTLLGLMLVGLGVLSRLVPHPPNMVAMGAIALYGGAKLPKRFALAVPVAAMAISDILINRVYNAAFFSLPQLVSYATFILIVLIGMSLARSGGPMRRGLLAVGSALLFFVTTNFAVWVAPHMLPGSTPTVYPMTAAGLQACYLAALPFLWNQVMAELVGVTALFGLDFLGRALIARKSTPENTLLGEAS